MHGHGSTIAFFNRFNRNPFLFGSGWGWDWGWGYGNNGNNTTVVVSQPPVSRFPVAGATGSTGSGACIGIRIHSPCYPQVAVPDQLRL